jgi:hypothetical protein
MESEGKAISPIPAKRRRVQREANAILAGKLEPWEEKHCRWLAECEGNVSYPDQAFVCSSPEFAGRTVSVDEVKKLRDKRAWRNLKYSIRAQRQEYADQAKSIINETLPEAASLHRRAIASLAAQPDGKLDVRAIPSLTMPLLERAWPKKTETENRTTVVTINISATQKAGLDEQPIDVEAEVVEAEIIP